MMKSLDKLYSGGFIYIRRNFTTNFRNSFFSLKELPTTYSNTKFQKFNFCQKPNDYDNKSDETPQDTSYLKNNTLYKKADDYKSK